MVFGRLAGLWLCASVEVEAWRVLENHTRLCSEVREDALSVRAGRFTPRAPGHRPALYRDVGPEWRTFRHNIHQDRQTLLRAAQKEHGALPAEARGAVGGVAADALLVERKGRGTRRDTQLYREMFITI